MAERYDNTKGGREFNRRSPSRVAASKAAAHVRQMSLLRKILMTLMVLGAMTTAVGAGTFASLSATTSNTSSTFQSGSIVLSDQVASGTACISNAAASSVDTNSNSNCDVMFDATSVSATSTDKHPGDNTQITMHIRNAGTLAGTLSVNAAANCSSSAAADQTANGTTSACNTVQLGIQDSTTCYYGDNMTTAGTAAYITGSPLGSSLSSTVDLTSYNRFKLTVNGTAHDNLQITSGTYTLTNLVTAVNSVISAWATASLYQATSSAISGQYELRITSNTTSGNIKLNIPTTTPSATGLAALGFMDGASAGGPGQCATLTGDQDHSLGAFRTAYQSTALSLGAISALTTRDFTVTAQVPGVVGDQAQGNMASFELTWNLIQS